MQFVKPQLFQEAVDKLGAKSLIGSALNSEQWSAVPVALRERAFFSATVESTRFLQRSRDSIGDFLTAAREEITLPNGTKTTALKTGSRQAFIKQLQDFAHKEGLGPIDPTHEGTIRDVKTEARLGLIFDTQTRQAQDYGWWHQGQDPDVLNAFPAQRFIRERAVKEPRDTHQLHEGEVHLKTDIGFWTALNRDFGVPWGPWGWGCGHDVEDVARAEAEKIPGVMERGQVLKPVEKDFNDRLEASVQNLDPDLVDHLKESFGDQIHIQDGAAKWTGGAAAHPSKGLPPAPAPTIRLPIPPRHAPVSQQLQILATGGIKDSIAHAIEQVDRVHDDGTLPPLPVDTRTSRGSLGTYYGTRMAVKPSGPWPELTTAHEIGHFLDEHGLPGRGFSSDVHPALEPWRSAVQRSAAYQRLMAGKKTKYRSYLQRWKELWARSYAQYIATRSDDKTMLGQVARITSGKSPAAAESHWLPDDFAPIAESIDTLFQQIGWL